MNSKTMGLGAIIVGILIAATQALNLAGELNYLWAILAIIWGAMAWAKK
ncbi:MAG: hypothetical protein HYW25_02500 [Candidatus Aenigmarchaeota archaeon]|nr:hypothetical protein [Candidatus Aenigmarchaeota archaeon]